MHIILIRTFCKSAFVRLSDKALGSELFLFKNLVRVAFESIAKFERGLYRKWENKRPGALSFQIWFEVPRK